MRKIVNYLIAVALLAFSVSATAQTGLGTLQGIVFDEQDAVVPNVAVTITSPAIMGERSMMTSSKGVYRFINLPPGVYTVHVEKENFRKFEQRGISVRAGKTSGLNITLSVGEFEEMITIIHDAPIIDLKSTERQINIDGDFVRRLPLHPNREWTGIFSLIPAAVYMGEFDTTGSALRGSYAPDVTFHGARDYGTNVYNDIVAGARSNENIFAMDGARLQSDTAFAPTSFTSTIIEDVEIITSGYNASLQSGLGGYVNIITKSGGNDFHGTAQITMQPQSWNWSNIEDGDPPLLGMYMPEVSLGGPIFKDRTWFFGSYLYDARNEGLYRSATTLLWFDKLGFERPTWESTRRSNRFFGKVTHALTERDKLVFTYNWDRIKTLTGDDNADASALRNEYRGGPFVSLNYITVLGDNFNVSVVASYRSGESGRFPRDGEFKPSITRTGETYFAGGNRYAEWQTAIKYNGMGWGFTNTDKHVELKADANLYLEKIFGNHDTHFGIYYIPMQRRLYETFSAQPVSGMSEILGQDGNWVTFSLSETKGAASSESNTKNLAGYLQDAWTINDRLTVNWGLRAEQNFDEVGTHRGLALSPNVGFAYALTSDQKQALRFSYTRRSEVISINDIFSSQNSNAGGITYFDNDLDGVWDSIFENIGGTTINTLGNLTQWGFPLDVSPDLRPSKADMFQLGYTTVLPFDITFDAAFIYNIFSDAARSYQTYNYIWDNGQPIGLRYPGQSRAFLVTNNEWSSHHFKSLELTATRNFRNNWQLMASYAWQDQTLKGEWSPYEPEHYFYPESWFEFSRYGELPHHTFRLAGSYIAPFGIMLNGNLSYRSSLPLPPYRFITSVFPNEPRYIVLDDTRVFNPLLWLPNYPQPRSAERRSVFGGVYTMNLGLGKIFNLGRYRLEGQFQVFNLFNGNEPLYGGNLGLVDEDLQDLPYLYISAIQSPRAAQLMLKVMF